jgi:hypothetical protein
LLLLAYHTRVPDLEKRQIEQHAGYTRRKSPGRKALETECASLRGLVMVAGED